MCECACVRVSVYPCMYTHTRACMYTHIRESSLHLQSMRTLQVLASEYGRLTGGREGAAGPPRSRPGGLRD